MKEILLTRRFLTGVMHVQLDNTGKAKLIYAKRSSLENYGCFETDLGEDLLDKDQLFFCPHINAKTSTLRILFTF